MYTKQYVDHGKTWQRNLAPGSYAHNYKDVHVDPLYLRRVIGTAIIIMMLLEVTGCRSTSKIL